MRSTRTIALLLVAALCTTIVAVCAVTASGKTKQPNIKVLTAQKIVATWTCQDQRGVPRTRARSPWKPHSRSYRTAELNLWKFRHKACVQALHAHNSMIRLLNIGLSGTPMAGTGANLEAAGRRYGIHPAFIAAIAGTESSFGHAACQSNRYNAFGLSSCGSGWSVPNFQSWSEVYFFMGKFLSSRWSSAATTYDYHGYAANSQSWGAKCAYWMRVRFGLGNSVRYR